MSPLKVSEHFRQVAGVYDLFRERDKEIVDLIAKVISEVKSPLNLDIASGTARYPIAIARKYGHKFVCVDRSKEMLDMARAKCEKDDAPIKFIQADCSDLAPVVGTEVKYRVVTIMNALNHFPDIAAFTGSVSKVMSDKGYFLIYTRVGDQNERTIWGQYFPEWAKRETSFLGHSGFPLGQLGEEISQGGMQIVEVKEFELKRSYTLPELIERIELKYYSSFSRYPKEGLKEHKETFIKKIHQAFPESRNNPRYKISHLSPMSMIFCRKK